MGNGRCIVSPPPPEGPQNRPWVIYIHGYCTARNAAGKSGKPMSGGNLCTYVTVKQRATFTRRRRDTEWRVYWLQQISTSSSHRCQWRRHCSSSSQSWWRHMTLQHSSCSRSLCSAVKARHSAYWRWPRYRKASCVGLVSFRRSVAYFPSRQCGRVYSKLVARRQQWPASYVAIRETRIDTALSWTDHITPQTTASQRLVQGQGYPVYRKKLRSWEINCLESH